MHLTTIIIALKDATPIRLAFEIRKSPESLIKLAGIWLVFTPRELLELLNFAGPQQDPEAPATTPTANTGVMLLRSNLNFIR